MFLSSQLKMTSPTNNGVVLHGPKDMRMVSRFLFCMHKLNVSSEDQVYFFSHTNIVCILI